jgi:hypothetical protein
MCALSNTEEFIKKARNIHNDRYDYSKTKYINSSTKVIITCRIHGDFLQTPNKHLSGRNCAKCAKCYHYTTDEFIIQANSIYHNKYDYSKTKYINSITEIIIICKIHGEFKLTPNKHLGGQGCKKCNFNYVKNTEKFIEQANIIHNYKYDYSKTNYINNYTKVIITCKIHGDFKQTPANHISGRGCYFCSLEDKSYDTNEFIRKASLIHNNKYDYSKSIYIRATSVLIIICPIHGEFKQTANQHLTGHGCRKCAALSISKPEIEWLDCLNILEENRQKRIKIKNKIFKVDGFDPETNTVYEFYGDFWHGNPSRYLSEDINLANKRSFGDLYHATIEREELLKSAGYNLITIWESDYKNTK